MLYDYFTMLRERRFGQLQCSISTTMEAEFVRADTSTSNCCQLSTFSHVLARTMSPYQPFLAETAKLTTNSI